MHVASAVFDPAVKKKPGSHVFHGVQPAMQRQDVTPHHKQTKRTRKEKKTPSSAREPVDAISGSASDSLCESERDTTDSLPALVPLNCLLPQLMHDVSMCPSAAPWYVPATPPQPSSRRQGVLSCCCVFVLCSGRVFHSCARDTFLFGIHTRSLRHFLLLCRSISAKNSNRGAATTMAEVTADFVEIERLRDVSWKQNGFKEGERG